jgi:hypothetical protein
VRQLLARRVREWAEDGFLDLTVLLVLEPSDAEAAIVGALGFSLHDGPLDWVQFHHGFYEAMVVVGNDPFAYFLIVPDLPGVNADLLELCRIQAGR